MFYLVIYYKHMKFSWIVITLYINILEDNTLLFVCVGDKQTCFIGSYVFSFSIGCFIVVLAKVSTPIANHGKLLFYIKGDNLPSFPFFVHKNEFTTAHVDIDVSDNIVSRIEFYC